MTTKIKVPSSIADISKLGKKIKMLKLNKKSIRYPPYFALSGLSKIIFRVDVSDKTKTNAPDIPIIMAATANKTPAIPIPAIIANKYIE